ncbi:uncharacterized protein L203_103217 [Cryptococcus depauperatus CBS 7841]|uniref:Nucleoside phosphatase n=1 Tax=Cryptococcus depauperatus CBS 7841 TaxID=1295531 RepID=A0AAJ8M1G8_9TREE
MAPSTTPLTTHYALVIDAGSSGSRLQIYSWRDPDLERAEIIKDIRSLPTSSSSSGGRWWWGGQDGYKGKGREQDMQEKALRRLVKVGKGVEGDDWVKRIEPGISSINPSDIGEYLAPLLSHALQHIPPSVQSSTPIYMLATAGMRLLSSERRDAILATACSTLRDRYPFRVDGPSGMGPCGESVRVISGEEEGIWGWVAVNYLMDGFGHAPLAQDDPHGLLPLAPLAEAPPESSSGSVTPVDVAHHSPTFGFLDMGGASTQLAFSPTHTELLSSGFPLQDLKRVTLRLLSGEDVEWDVFAASWLGFGTNRARERYVENLLKTWQDMHAKGDMAETENGIPDPCLPVNLKIPSSSRSPTPELIGTGSFSDCLTALTPLLQHSAPCPTSYCLFAGQPTPHIDFDRSDQRGFIGISEYWYTTRHVLNMGKVWDWGEWENGMNEYCGKSWEEVQREVEQGGLDSMNADPSRPEMQCFKGAWISNVLHNGIGIPRLVDAGGNLTLTGGTLGDTNIEAERRAREKGLVESFSPSQRKGHFQSMDEIGETAISWTLGKMIIEASKAVPPRSHSAESWWTQHLAFLGLSHNVQGHLEGMGVSFIWIWVVLWLALVGWLFKRHRCNQARVYAGYGHSPSRRRKPSISTPYSSFDLNSRMSWLSSIFSSFDSASTLEDGFVPGPGIAAGLGTTVGGESRFSTPGRLRLWSLRISNLLNRSLPFTSSSSQNILSLGGMGVLGMKPRTRMSSMPGGITRSTLGMGGGTPAYTSQPGTPRSSPTYFIPAQSQFVNNQTPTSIKGGISGIETTPEMLATMSSARSISPVLGTPGLTTSPPSHLSLPRSSFKSNSRPYKSRQNSHHTAVTGSGSGGEHTLTPTTATSAGWNDPPVSMLSPTTILDGFSVGIGTGGMFTPLGSRVLSRNSSRVNLSEMGLAQRSMSRAGTPGFDNDDA